MKIENIIRRVLREQEEKLSELPPFDDFFDSDWNLVLNFMGIYPNKKFYYPSDLDLRYTEIETLGNLVRVEGNLDLTASDIESLGSLVRVEGDLDLHNCKNLQSLGNLRYVGGWLYLWKTDIKSLGNLERVDGDLDLQITDVETLRNLKYVGGFLNLYLCRNLQSLGNLEYVGGNFILNDTPLSKKYTKEEIRNMVEVVGKVYMDKL